MAIPLEFNYLLLEIFQIFLWATMKSDSVYEPGDNETKQS